MLRRRADGERRERDQREREKERVRGREREKRHPVAWWVPRYEGIRADRRGRTGRGKAKRGEARRGEARVPLAPELRGPGPTANLRKT